MSREPIDRTLAQTYVWHGDKAFMVSTINRASSAVAAYGQVYAETMVWEWRPETKERGAIIGQDSASAGSLYAHQQMVERLFATGRCEADERMDQQETGE